MANKSTKKSTNKSSNIGPAGKVVIVLFAVLMALSLMLPSLQAIFSSSKSDDSSSAQQSSSSSFDSSQDSSSASDSGTNSNIAKADDKYGEAVKSLEEKYASDSQNLATLLNLGKDYMTWGTYVRYYGTTDADATHANDLLGKAVKYYDEYLALKDSNAVRVDKALCAYYQQDGTSALQQMKDLTASAPDYGPAWANLGMLYEASGDNDSAKAAYAKAQQTDPDDEYGAKSYATQRLQSMESAQNSSSSADGSSADGSTSTTGSSQTGAQGLSDTLGDLSGTGL